MADVFYKITITFPVDGLDTTIGTYKKCDSTVYDTDRADTEAYLLDLGTKQNGWDPVSVTPVTTIITKAEYDKLFPTNTTYDFVVEDLTPPDPPVDEPII
jgi:hypothetical protein